MTCKPLSVRYTLYVYLCGLLFFTLFRLLFIALHAEETEHIPGLPEKLIYTLFTGLRFDTVVSGYILLLPYFCLSVATTMGTLRKWQFRTIHSGLCIVYLLSFLLCAADIPFFGYYGSRLNVTVLNWTGSPSFVVKMILQDYSYRLFLLLFISVALIFLHVMRNIYRSFLQALTKGERTIPAVASCTVFAGVMLLGIRGRTDEKSPILPGTAGFCESAFLNEAGLNPMFTFFWSLADAAKPENQELLLVANDSALFNTRRLLGIDTCEDGITRTVNTNSRQHNYNVVLVIMESMSAYYMQHMGNKLNLTPTLDTLANGGIYFSNFYSAGIHTYNGIFSTLYGHPAVMGKHTMEGAVIPSYLGLPATLKARGYDNIYFTTHDDQFDNVSGFLLHNHFHKIISKDDYDADKIRSTLGVSDHDMFSYAVPYITRSSEHGRPFFATLMTASNHPPYIVPAEVPFHPRHTEISEGCVEYADWAIGYFMRLASGTSWYRNTIFVFTGDHGTLDGPVYGPVHLAFNRVPCIIYAPGIGLQPGVISTPGGQIDISATVAGLLGGTYTDGTMGLDLLRHQRRWAAFSQDDKIVVADTDKIYIWQHHGQQYLYDMISGEDILQQQSECMDSMKLFGFSMVQTAQVLRQHYLIPDKHVHRSAALP